MKRWKIQPKSFAISVLKGLAITGMVLVAASNPQFGPRVLKAILKDYKRKKSYDIYKSLHYLHDRGYVEFVSLGNVTKVKITHKGREIMKQVDIETIELTKPNSWDEKCRVVIFDVPNWKNRNRAAFTDKLKEIGFRMIQKSVWVYPYPCHEEIMILRKFYEIEREVTFLETAMVEDQELWRKHFVHLFKVLPRV